MAWIKESDCVSCERCCNCGAREGYYVPVCDLCRSEQDKTYDIDGIMLCRKCAINYFLMNYMEDVENMIIDSLEESERKGDYF